MDNLDEKILALRNLQKNKEDVNISEGVYINEAFVKFHEIDVLDGQLKLFIPVDFTTMREDIARIKYPSENRPQCIKTSADTAVNIGMSLLPTPIDGNNLESEISDFKQILKSVNPAFEFYTSGIEDLEDFNLGWFDYKSFALDQQMYNINFAASVDGQMLYGFFNCPFSCYDQWKPAALEMIKSIKKNKGVQI